MDNLQLCSEVGRFVYLETSREGRPQEANSSLGPSPRAQVKNWLSFGGQAVRSWPGPEPLARRRQDMRRGRAQLENRAFGVRLTVVWVRLFRVRLGRRRARVGAKGESRPPPLTAHASGRLCFATNLTRNNLTQAQPNLTRNNLTKSTIPKLGPQTVPRRPPRTGQKRMS